jgi:hypothetical protein
MCAIANVSESETDLIPVPSSIPGDVPATGVYYTPPYFLYPEIKRG